MSENLLLSSLIHYERFREMLRVLTPAEISVVALRLEYDLSLTEIAELFGVSRVAVTKRLQSAQDRILQRFPELRIQAEERNFVRNRHRREHRVQN